MGVKGLTWFMESKADELYEDFELCDSYLVIDGNNLFGSLFDQLKLKNIIHGGDYGVFAQHFGHFMDEFLKCGVKPLVLFDGGIEDKKIKTIIERNNQKIKRVYDLQCQDNFHAKPLLPLMLRVFQDVLKERNIKYARTMFEADNSVASVARLLNCPLLSFDSDFYLFDVKYIPFTGLQRCFSRDGKFVKKCKIFRISNLCKQYPGLQETSVPLIAVLLGNDYLSNSSIFNNFYNTLKLTKNDMTIPEQLQRIQAVLRFLQKNSLRRAITKILNKIETEQRAVVLNIIEIMLNYYFHCSSEAMKPLGFSEEKICEMVKGLKFNPFINEKFAFVAFDLGAINLPDEPLKSNEFYLKASHYSGLTEFAFGEKGSEIVDLLPPWFLDEFNQGDFPGYFMDLLTKRFYISSVCLEDCFEKPYVETSLNIIRTICQLLYSGTTEKQTFRYFARKKERPFGQESRFTVKSGKNIPTLAELRQIPVKEAKKILHEAVGITDSSFEEIPCEWKLFIISIFYWIENCTAINEFHVDALILSLIYNIVSKKMNHATCETFSKIPFRECISFAKYYSNNLDYNRSTKFRVSTIHPFLLFQNILYHMVHLNALLGNVYLQPKMSDLYFGTFIYNILEISKTYDKSEDLLDSIFGTDSPSLRFIFSRVKKSLQPAIKKLHTNLYKEIIFDPTRWSLL